MSLQSMIAGVVAVLLVSAGGMAWGAATNSRLITVLAALAYTLVILFVAWRVNRAAWIGNTAGDDELFHTMRRNTRLAALVYAWGAAAFFAIYGLTNVRWQHGFQYGTGAALLAAAFLYYVHKMDADGANTPPAVWLTVAHGLAITTGLAFLVGAGKLGSTKGDWPANYIFLFGGLALFGLCYIAFRTQVRMMKT